MNPESSDFNYSSSPSSKPSPCSKSAKLSSVPLARLGFPILAIKPTVTPLGSEDSRKKKHAKSEEIRQVQSSGTSQTVSELSSSSGSVYDVHSKDPIMNSSEMTRTRAELDGSKPAKSWVFLVHFTCPCAGTRVKSRRRNASTKATAQDEEIESDHDVSAVSVASP